VRRGSPFWKLGVSVDYMVVYFGESLVYDVLVSVVNGLRERICSRRMVWAGRRGLGLRRRGKGGGGFGMVKGDGLKEGRGGE